MSYKNIKKNIKSCFFTNYQYIQEHIVEFCNQTVFSFKYKLLCPSLTGVWFDDFLASDWLITTNTKLSLVDCWLTQRQTAVLGRWLGNNGRKPGEMSSDRIIAESDTTNNITSNNNPELRKEESKGSFHVDTAFCSSNHYP